jgi:FkbM family methyltransferase
MPLLAHRSLSKILGAAFQKRHYRAAVQMGLQTTDFFDVFKRYLSGKGNYPFTCSVRTPTGIIKPTLYSYYDLLTLNEIFFRNDYPATSNDKVIVDIGSNIGLSALYFLTRTSDATCTMFEPDPKNVERLTHNLENFHGRYLIKEAAVSDQTGQLKFGLDVISGRYGGLGVDFGHFITVSCVHINTVLKEVLAQHDHIDILKIDTEGSEIKTIKAIAPDFLMKIKKIFMEAEPTESLHPDFFSQRQTGTVCQLLNNKWPS